MQLIIYYPLCYLLNYLRNDCQLLSLSCFILIVLRNNEIIIITRIIYI